MEEYVELCKKTKLIHDSIHDYIELTIFATKIIDTKFFQRLRKLKQLGTCNYVYPNAVHTRFEHSIGTYHVASLLLNSIVSTTDPKYIDNYLKEIPELHSYYERMYDGKIHILDTYICELIKIAALCHDIGHGPFSHVFDDVFIPITKKNNCVGSTHEERSGIILELIINNDKYLKQLILPDEIQFMKNIIDPDDTHTGFVYQIVSNLSTGLDVDKFDYLKRDISTINFQAKIEPSRLINYIRIINNNIVYPEQSIDDIYNLFQTRFRLHKQVYCHKAVIAVQFIIVELLQLLDDILNISDSIDNMNEFCKLTDEYILESVNIIDKFKSNLSDKQLINLNNAKLLMEKLENRNLYAVILSITTKTQIDISKYVELLPDKENILVFQHKIGFVSGNKSNPFDSIYVYKTKNSSKISGKIEAFKKNKNDVTTLLPTCYQEYMLTIYYKDKTNISRIKELRDFFDIGSNFIQ